ncbi:MAG TPA: AAA-like domain-containing protein [Ktedonobacteraceae bacterium]|nr:AAA-like domain-containing protein [Ktedonobacteraceae bacterium]
MQVNPKPANPYYNRDAVRDLSMFFGRQDELRILYNAIDKRQCFSIVGSRHIGKSSLLQFLGEPELQQRYGYDLHDRIFILTDCREFLQRTREDFFRSVCDQIVAQSRHRISLQQSSLSEESKFKSLLEDIRRAGFRPVLLMDAFDRVTRNPHFDPDFFSFLRSLAGIYDLISYVTASRKPLYDVCHSDAVASSPFFNIFQNCTLGPLTLEEARALITTPAHLAGCDFTPQEVEWVLAQAGRHPFFVQVACHHLFEENLRQHHQQVDLKHVQECMYRDLIPHFDNLWHDLDENQKSDLKLEALQLSNPRRHIPELSESLLFRKRIREIAQTEAPTITIKDVKDALDNLDDTDFLDSCTLSETRYVALRARGETAPQTANKKGKLVRDFLRTGFERMRPGNSLRTDSALEWRLYNILWYHYFRYHLPNPQTAARLNIGSMRQFYREQERALQALLKELLAMENDSINAGE